MTLNSSGVISTGNGVTGQDISIELGRSGTVVNICTDSDALTLAGKTLGQTVSFSDFFGKSKTVPFTPVTRVYTSGSGTETAPSGASNVVIEIWGGGECGAHSNKNIGGGGGGSGGYSKSSYSITGGNTLNYSVGTGGTGGYGASGTSSTVTSGTKTITNMTANSGSGATILTAGSGGSASGGNLINTTGNSGNTGDDSDTAATGGVGITGSGTYGAGGSGGPSTGGFGTGATGRSGNNGAVRFYYS